MTSSPAVPPRRSFFRTVAPFLIVGLAAAVIVGAWTLPLENTDRLQRVLTTNLTILVGVLLLAAWLIFLSGWRLWQRMGVLVCAACVIMGAVKKVSFTGDMAPIFHYRWENPMAAAGRATGQSKACRNVRGRDLRPSPAIMRNIAASNGMAWSTGRPWHASGRRNRRVSSGGSPSAAAMPASSFRAAWRSPSSNAAIRKRSFATTRPPAPRSGPSPIPPTFEEDHGRPGAARHTDHCGRRSLLAGGRGRSGLSRSQDRQKEMGRQCAGRQCQHHVGHERLAPDLRKHGHRQSGGPDSLRRRGRLCGPTIGRTAS